jgi:signal transduction histidine kinase
MVDNLLENAARHGRRDGTVRIALRPQADGRGPEIDVDDDGPGIPPDERERVFEPFRRVNGSAARAGSGLGLALVAQQARLHGATVTVNDSPLGGARLRVEFPARAPAQDP